MLSKIDHPRRDLQVWLLTAKGMIALVESDAKSANRDFKEASDIAATMPEFDEVARYNLKQRLAFTYIRLGDGATAERLARELIAPLSTTSGPDSPYVLRVRLNLAQAFMIQKKFREAVDEANAIYPDFLKKLGPDHQLTMQLLATRAQSEGSIGLFDDSVRDDLLVYGMAVTKQGPLSFYSIATLSDASVGQCRANHLVEGEANARKAHDAAAKAFGPQIGAGARNGALARELSHRPGQAAGGIAISARSRREGSGPANRRSGLGRWSNAGECRDSAEAGPICAGQERSRCGATGFLSPGR